LQKDVVPNRNKVKKNNYKKAKGKDFIKVEINNYIGNQDNEKKQFTSVLLTVSFLRLNFIENNSKGNSKYKTKYFVAGNEIKIQFSSDSKPQIPNFISYSFLWKNATRRNL
jgi:hypothetical protein